MELGDKTRKSIQTEGMSLYDKLAAIAQAQEDIGELPEYLAEDGEEA